MNEEEVFAKARQLRAAGVPLAEVEQYIQSKLGAPATEEPKADLVTKVLGTAASLVRDIPGMEAVQSGASALVNRIPYSEARAQIRAAEDATPKKFTIPARLAGGTLAAAATPGAALKVAGRTVMSAPVASGALYGAASGALDSDMDQSIESRLARTAAGATVGGIAAKGADVLTTAGKGMLAKTLGEAATTRSQATARITEPLYAAAKREGASNAGQPVPLSVLEALDKPDVKKYADLVMGSRQYASADHATIVRETFKLMSKQQSGLMRRLQQNGFDAATALEAENLRLAKQELATAAAPLMPSWAKANAAYAAGKGERQAFNKTAEGINRIINKSKVAPGRLDKNSPRALEDAIAAMKPADAAAGLEAALGSLKENAKIGPTANVLTGFGTAQGFGLLPILAKANRASPFVRELERRAGKTAVRSGARAAAVAGTAPRWLEDLLR
jgi:hypothetical protein